MDKEQLVLWEGCLPISSIDWHFDSNKSFKFSSEFEQNQLKYWNQIIQKYPRLYDGNLLILDQYSIQKNRIILETRDLSFSKLAYLIEQKLRLPESYGTLGFQVFISHSSKDWFLLGKRSHSSEYKPGHYTIPGGMFEVKDIDDSIANACLREIAEEVFLELKTSSLSLIALLRELNGLGVVLLLTCSLDGDSYKDKLIETSLPANEEWHNQSVKWFPFADIHTLDRELIMEGLLYYTLK